MDSEANVLDLKIAIKGGLHNTFNLSVDWPLFINQLYQIILIIVLLYRIILLGTSKSCRRCSFTCLRKTAQDIAHFL